MIILLTPRQLLEILMCEECVFRYVRVIQVLLMQVILEILNPIVNCPLLLNQLIQIPLDLLQFILQLRVISRTHPLYLILRNLLNVPDSFQNICDIIYPPLLNL